MCNCGLNTSSAPKFTDMLQAGCWNYSVSTGIHRVAQISPLASEYIGALIDVVEKGSTTDASSIQRRHQWTSDEVDIGCAGD